MKVLVVDDSSSMRQMVSFTVKTLGFDVSEAADGVEALAWAKSNKADLVLSDVNMPNMDGIELVTHLRTLDDYQYVPILMITTESSQEKRMKGKQAGATGWIVKPFNPEQLIKTIQKVVEL